MTSPLDRTVTSSTSNVHNFSGQVLKGGSQVTLQAYYPALNNYYSFATTASSSSSLPWWGLDWHGWSRSTSVPSWAWERLGNGSFARVRAIENGALLSTLRTPFLPCLDAHGDSALDFEEACLSVNSPDAFLYTTGYPATMDALLATCPTQLEINRALSDMNVFFDPGVDTSYACTPGGTESGPTLSIVNAIRALKLIRFDTPMELLGVTNVFDWLKQAGLQIRVHRGDLSYASGNTLYIREGILSQANLRAWVNPSTGTGLIGLTGLLVHEGRHAEGHIGHDCGGDDSSLGYGGAWAAQYWYHRALAEHSGSLFTPAQITAANGEAALALSRICD